MSEWQLAILNLFTRQLAYLISSTALLALVIDTDM